MITSACWMGLLLFAQVPPPAVAPEKVSELRKEYEATIKRETDAITALAGKLQKQGKAKDAEECRRKIDSPQSPDGASRFVPLLEVVPRRSKALANVPVKGAGAEPWRGELDAIRETCGKALFEIAQKAAAKIPGQFALADQALRGVVARLPDHPEARRLLGFVSYEGGWATPFAARLLRKKMINHPVFGWVEWSWVPHLDQGELPAPPTRGQQTLRWLPAEQADELHRPWESRWRIHTEHFDIHTNVKFSDAIAFGRQLESFHELFLALFADVLRLDHPDSLATHFKDKTKGKNLEAERGLPPHQVYYFATKQEYVDHLSFLGDPNIDKTLGRYLPPKPRQGNRAPAYLFHDPGGQLEVSATLFHEVSHQLLFESVGRSEFERNAGNYWVFEGLGTYFETVSMLPDGSILYGGRTSPRLEEARIRLVDRDELVPTETFVGFGQNEFNEDSVIYLHYAQAMALTIYLMQSDQAEHREAFLDYVKDAHKGRLRRDGGKSLRERIGISYSKLDRDLIRYLGRVEAGKEKAKDSEEAKKKGGD